MGLDQPLRDGEPEPDAPGRSHARATQPDEGREDPVRVRGRDARPVIAHFEANVAVVPRDADADLASGR